MKVCYIIFTIALLLIACKKEEKSIINIELKKELAEIEFKDQFMRSITEETPKDSLDWFAKRININPEYFRNNYKSLAVQIDEENKRRVLEIIKKNGYPGKSLVGTPENSAAWLVIQHSSPEVIQEYLPMLRKAVKNRELQSTALALTEDRNLMYQGKEQLYGTQFSEIDGKIIVWPIKNYEKVNELRKEVGFMNSFEDDAKMFYGKEFITKNYTLDEVKKMRENFNRRAGY